MNFWFYASLFGNVCVFNSKEKENLKIIEKERKAFLNWTLFSDGAFDVIEHKITEII